eukprot:3935411-Rhodomonas_salina.1
MFALNEPEYEAGGHGWQLADSFEPTWKAPAVQQAHDVCPGSVWKCPSIQSVHGSDPGFDLKVPAWHAVHRPPFCPE